MSSRVMSKTQARQFKSAHFFHLRSANDQTHVELYFHYEDH